MSELFVKLEQPVLTGLELKLPAGSEVYPKTVPDLYLGEPVLVSVKLPAQGGEAVLSGNLNGEAWTRRLSLNNPGSENGISQLWARAKIEELNDNLIRGGNWEILQEDMTQLALKHHLVTDYTSLVAVDKTPVRPANENLETEPIPQNLPADQSYEAIFGEADSAIPMAAPVMMVKTNQAVGFADTATLAPLNLIIGLITLLLACLLLVKVSRNRMRA
jgi:Ca-activated chloride channel family protein